MSERRFARLLISCAVLLAFIPPVLADEPQKPATDEPGRIGLTVAYPQSTGLIGFVWEKSERLALRPTVAFQGSAFDSSSSKTFSIAGSLSVLRYVGQKDSARAYVGPRFAYTHGWRSSAFGTDTNSAYGVGGLAGLQYALTHRISVWGEAGVDYTFATAGGTAGGITTNSHTHNIASRSGLGLNLYF